MTHSLFKKRKGNAILDTAVIMVTITALLISTFVGLKVWQDMETDVRAMVTTTEGVASLDMVDNRYATLFDNVFVFVLVGLWIVALIASYMIDAHPVFFAITIILLVVIMVAGVFLSNFYSDFIADPEYATMDTSFPMTNWIMEHMLMIIIIFGSSIMLVLYSKMRA